MAINPSLVVDIAAEFVGKRAFGQADTATKKLEKNVKSLGRTIGITFGTAAVLAYSKASVKAAAADITAQKQLALSLKNVGLSRDAASAEGYIQRLQSEVAVLDDLLRPAYAKLAIATKDTYETQRLLSISLDISKSTGKDLDSVVSALSKAYLGNNTALSKLGVGIAKADLKTKSFQEITDQLAVTFAGAAKASADSFTGSIDRLSIASNNAKEIIGTSLIGALQSLGEDDSMATLSTNIENAAKSLANFIDSIVYLKEQIASIPGAGIVSGAFGLIGSVLGKFSPQRLAELIKAVKGFQGMGNVAMTGGSNMDTQKYDAQQKKILADKIKSDKLIAANKIKADKLAAANKAKLDKAAKLFDITAIGIAAALKGKITEEEKIRLLLMQAIADEDAKKAEDLSKKLDEIQEKNLEIAKSLTEISETADPFTSWATSLGAAAAVLRSMPSLITASGALTGRGAVTIAPEITDNNPIPVSIIPDLTMPSTNIPSIPVPSDMWGSSSGGFGWSVPGGVPGGGMGGVTVNVTGSVIMQDEFVRVVNDAVIAANTNGYNNYRPGAILP
jgi:hypothetical protein